MSIKADTYLIKEINKSLVLETIKNHFPISRADVNRLSGLHKGTVSNIVNELIKEHLVYETGPGESSGGRKPVMLMFNNEAGYAIGINIEIKQITAIITDLNGTVIRRKQVPLINNTFEYVYRELVEVIDALIQVSPKSEYGIVGIGIGFQGSIDSRGNILIAPTFEWENIPLQKLLENEFNVPIVVNNEAKVGSEAERTFGFGKESNNFLYLSINHGIGGSHIFQNEIYKGHNGGAGNVGHMSLDRNGKVCSCGNVGCWQLYASVKTLLEKAETLTCIRELRTSPNLSLLLRLAEDEQQEVIDLFAEIGRNIGIGISNLIHVLNPDLIVIGGKMAECKKWIHDSIVNTIYQRANFFYKHHLHLEYSKLGGDCTVLGAASTGISQLLTVTKVTKI